jgi:hypothetical protein
LIRSIDSGVEARPRPAGANSTGDSIAAVDQILGRVAVDREGVAFDPGFDRPQ